MHGNGTKQQPISQQKVSNLLPFFFSQIHDMYYSLCKVVYFYACYQHLMEVFTMIIYYYNNGNVICVFECTIVNLATYRQFTNAAWDWIIKKNNNNQNCTKPGLSQFLFLQQKM